jgi:cell division protease FtsH
VLLGGRAAEQLMFAQVSTGAADDIARATDIARAMVMRHGMDDGLGCVAYAEPPSPFLDPDDRASARGGGGFSPDTAKRIDAAVQRIVQQAFDIALSVLRGNRTTLERCAQALLEHETLEEPDIRRLVGDLCKPPASGVSNPDQGVVAKAAVESPVSK